MNTLHPLYFKPVKILAAYSYNDIKVKFDFCGKDSDNPYKRLVDGFASIQGLVVKTLPVYSYTDK